jgi:GT2 family glycosyltransferase
MEARAHRDWPKADALKARIESAGWRVTDHGSRTSVTPAAPPMEEVEGERRFGSAAAVPSLLDEPATAAWTVVVVASEAPDRVSRLLAALRAHAPAGTQVVAVVNDPSEAQAASLRPEAPDRAPIGGLVPETLRTSARLGCAAALNIGLRRAAGELVLLADSTAWPTADAMTPLAATLQDPTVAAAGGFGLIPAGPGPLRPNALRRVEAAATADAMSDVAADATGDVAADATGDAAAAAPADVAATADVAALEGGWLAFRRSDYLELGPFDERFVAPAWLDVWWTLRLRAGAEPEGAEYVASEDGADDLTVPAGGRQIEASPVEPVESVALQVAAPASEVPAPRRAVRVNLPLEREDVAWPPDRSRLNRRNMYRVLDRHGWRDDLG